MLARNQYDYDDELKQRESLQNSLRFFPHIVYDTIVEPIMTFNERQCGFNGDDDVISNCLIRNS